MFQPECTGLLQSKKISAVWSKVGKVFSPFLAGTEESFTVHETAG